MRRPHGTGLARCLVVVALVLGTPGVARAESALWTLTASPLAVTTGVPTTFSLTATNDDPLADVLSSNEIGCLWVDVPSNFSVAGAGVTGSNTGGSWTASRAGNRVTIYATSGGDRLASLDWVSFTIRATALSAGSLAWNAKAHRQTDCSGSGALLGVLPVVVVSDPVATPASTPTPIPTAPATPSPTPLVTLPTLEILPTPTPTPIPTSASTPAPTPPDAEGGSPTPTPSIGGPSSQASPGSTTSPQSAGGEGAGQPGTPGTAGNSDGATATAGGSGGAGGAVTGPRVSFDRAGLGVELGAIGLLDGAGVWAVPAATIAGPGLLILLFIALQATGVAAWIPAVRRLRGEDERPG